jgi:hypothetical protein
MHGETSNAYIILVGKPKEKRPLGRPTDSWKDTKMDIKETGCGLDSNGSL